MTGTWMDIGADLRWALRSLRKRPTFATVAIVTLALGIGANSAIFTLVSAHFLTPLPYDRPDELALLWETGRGTREVTTVSPGNYTSWRDEAGSFVDIAAFNVDFATLSGDGPAERVSGSVVTPNFFDVLGSPPVLGPGFTEESVRAADGGLVILSHGLWVRRFGGDAAVIGSDVRVGGRPHTIVGVMGPAFRQPERSLQWQATELWRPMLLDGREDDHGSRYLRTIGRRQTDVSFEAATVEMESLAARLREAHPVANAERDVLVRTLDDYLMGAARPTLFMLLLAGVAVMLIVCANVANLTLARGEERRGEFAVRAALGSGRLRLLRQVIVEGVVLALLGAVVGTVAVFAGRDLLQIVQQRYFSGLVDISIDFGVVGVTTAVAVAAGVLFGLPLAGAASRLELRGSLGEGGQRGAGRASAGVVRNLLIVGQVGLATTLIVVAALLGRSFSALVATSPGFEAAGVLAFHVDAPSVSYPGADEIIRYHDALLEEVRAVPGVREVGTVSDLPFTTENMYTTLAVAGRDDDPAALPSAEYHVVTPGYFSVMGIPLVAGEMPGSERIEGEVPVLVSERMADVIWPAGDAVGARFDLDWGDTIPLRVRGVVANVLDDGYDADSEAAFFMPFGAMPRRRMAYVVRGQGSPAEIMDGVRAAVGRVDPDVPAAELRPLEGMMAETVARPRAASLIGSVFAFIALLVAAAGIYGVLSYSVQSRTRELGIRSALGADGKRLVSMVLGHSMQLLAVGLALGLIGAVVASRTLAGLLFGVKPYDPLSLVVAVIVLGGVGMLAAWLPARRVARVDPREALRSE